MYSTKILINLSKTTLKQAKIIGNCCKNNFSNIRLLSNVSLQSKVKETNLTSNLEQTQNQEHEFLLNLKNNPDHFGGSNRVEKYVKDDLEEEEYLETKPFASQKLSTKQYADLIKKLRDKRQIKEAIDVLEVKMLKEDRVKPENYIYNLLLGACGRVGYTKKAFALYNRMKQRGLKVTPGTYTALFNACANSPWPEDGLTRARHLREIMLEKMYEPNDTNYNAMIKAFGRCGDIETAFKLVDEMLAKKFVLKIETINFLLQACITNKDVGFRHAILVWRKLIEKNIKPSIYTYNLLLRATRDCGIGDVEITKNLLENVSPKLLSTTKHTEMIRPNLIAPVPHLGTIISLAEIKNPEDRLLLIGGCRGFLDNMKANDCIPNIKTFTQLLDVIPNTLKAESELLNVMKKLDVKPDIDFYNMLIRKRSLRFDYESAKEVLYLMEEMRFRPNIMTYGVLALGCKTKEEATELIETMHRKSFRLNIEILGAMLKQACFQKNFSYILELMELCLKEDIKPSKKFMEILDTFKKVCKKVSNDKTHELHESIQFQKGYRTFRMRLKSWLEQIQVDDSDKVHPWQQYRQNTTTNVENYKDKGDRFKARHTSKFKVKTSTKIRY